MQENNFSTLALIVGVVLLGIALLVGFIYLLPKQEEKVTLPVKFEEFADYQCPACGYYYPIIKKVLPDYVGKVDYQFKNFPLTQLHEFAYNSSLAAEAAGLQDKFSQYHDKLYENQDKLSDADLVKYAQDVGLDVNKFNSDRAGEQVKALVDADIAEGNSRNVDSTPTIFINNKRIVFLTGEDPETKLRQVLDADYALGLTQLNGSPTPSILTTLNPTTLSPTPTLTLTPTK
jgi:protein-disulfide isomerase